MKFLIADDNKTNRFILKKLFQKLNITDIDFVNDGNNAVDTYRKGVYDLVFLDQRMNKMNGDIAAKLILEKNPDAKIISISTFEEINSNLFCEHFEKPFTVASLKQLLQKLNVKF